MISLPQQTKRQIQHVNKKLTHVNQLLSNKYEKLGQSTTFLNELENLLAKLRRKQYELKASEPESPQIRKIRKLMDQVIIAVNETWKEINEFEEVIEKAEKYAREQKKILKDIYNVIVLRC